jgi:DNA topoisomerase II
VDNLMRMIKGEEPIEMIPFYKGFTGEITFNSTKKKDWISMGKIEKINENTLFVSELPIEEWTQDFKEKLEKMMDKEEIEDFRENHTGIYLIN